jgi:hypothetical protein
MFAPPARVCRGAYGPKTKYSILPLGAQQFLPLAGKRRYPARRSRESSAAKVVNSRPVISGRRDLKAPILYRIASILLLLFDLGHTLGFRQSDPSWGVDALLTSMRSIHFNLQGFSRSYWDLFVGAGFFVSVFLLFAAVLAWQLAGLPAETLAVLRRTQWAFALCFVAVTILGWTYFFTLPIVFLTPITLCLIAAAWLSGKPT